MLLFRGSFSFWFVGLVMGMGRMGRHKGSTGCICGSRKVVGKACDT